MLVRLLPALFLFVLVSCKVDPGTKTRKMIQRHADIALKPAIDEAAQEESLNSQGPLITVKNSF